MSFLHVYCGLNDDGLFKKRNLFKEQHIRLEEMRFDIPVALKDESYMSNCYAPSNDFINRGKMSLISPAFFSFTLQVMKSVRCACSKKQLILRKNEFIVLGKEELEDNDMLKKNILNSNVHRDKLMMD